MSTSIKILIVEDDMIIAAKISMQLTNLGYEVTGIVPRGEEALIHLEENRPDMMLLDINLKGTLDGIETAREMQRTMDIPIIFVTANSDEATFNRAKAVRPYAFISKPIKNIDLQRSIELTISRMADNHHQTVDVVAVENDQETPFILSDRIFVRHKEKMVKIFIEDILYIEADRNYCHIYTKKQDYLLAISLKNMEEKLTAPYFVRVHRSFVVNLTQVDEVAESHVILAGKAIPLSHTLREDLLRRIQTF
jgi:DNA-binding LytR/AlgR family response regulator